MRKHGARYQNIGSVSEGTMRLEDLIPTFLWEAEHLGRLTKDERKTVREIRKAMDDDAYMDSEQAGFDLDELFDLLDNHSPPFFYFGASEGDGASYGWWLPQDFGNDYYLDSIPKVSDRAKVVRDYYGYVVEVNDHGNMTLWKKGRNGHYYEMWSIV